MKRLLLVGLLLGCGATNSFVNRAGSLVKTDAPALCTCVYDGSGGYCLDRAGQDHPEADCDLIK